MYSCFMFHFFKIKCIYLKAVSEGAFSIKGSSILSNRKIAKILSISEIMCNTKCKNLYLFCQVRCLSSYLPFLTNQA